MLIFQNGHIEYGVETQSELFDINGNPMPSQPFVERAVCYIDMANENKHGSYNDGKFTQYSLSISINMESVPTTFAPQEIAVFHNRKGFLGKFVVQRIEWYDLTQTIVIWL